MAGKPFEAKKTSATARGAIPDVRTNSISQHFCSLVMDWKWELISIIQRDSYEEDKLIDPGHNAVHEIRRVAKQLNEASNLEDASETFLEIMTSSHKAMSHAATSSADLRTLRKVYTDAAILRALVQSLASHTLSAISTLDYSIIVAGPYGIERRELILGTIRRLQREISSRNPTIVPLLKPIIHEDPPSACRIASLLTPPSFLQFQMTYSRHPFILRGYAKDWPALTDRPWRSHTYLSAVAGPGRVVPIEVGDDYRTEDWQQKIMGWDEYLSFLDFEDHPPSGSSPHALYLAQHDLMKQFPELQDDILIPDYLYADLESPDFPSYCPPANNDKMVLNAWLGPQGTLSPAHTDPYFNFYVQVVGHKTVWLAPPSVSQSMYPFSPFEKVDIDDRHLPSSVLENTSRVDVFRDAEDMKHFPAFVDQVVPVSMATKLGPGDALFFPPGWWHAMKSESTSFSVSMWF